MTAFAVHLAAAVAAADERLERELGYPERLSCGHRKRLMLEPVAVYDEPRGVGASPRLVCRECAQAHRDAQRARAVRS